ncbi:hypothetical protein ACI6Q2_14370 [Chitinophagaceae bacterium LWZ2-11]
MMNRIVGFFLIFILLGQIAKADVSNSFVVKGDLDKYYPVTFEDNNWDDNRATILEIGRSSVHTDEYCRGSVIAKFTYHTTGWGNGSSFINADIRSGGYAITAASIVGFVGGWSDATGANGIKRIIVWLRGGTTTYYYYSSNPLNPIVYDGVQNALPFAEPNGLQHTFKINAEAYVNNNGVTLGGDFFLNGNAQINGATKIKSANSSYPLIGARNPLYLDAENFGSSNSSAIVFSKGNGIVASIATDLLANGGKDIFTIAGDGNANILFNPFNGSGNVGIGVTTPTEKLSVNGNIRTKKLIVTQTGWPDYVFDSSYTLTPLTQVEQFIKDNKHLPDVPSAKEVADKGLDVGDNQAVLLKKIEELTLYMIEMKKENDRMKEEMIKKINAQQKEIEKLKK